MIFFKFVIYFLNWDSYAKRIVFLFLYPWIIHIQNNFLLLRVEGGSLEDQW